jgi:hypothetical protein
VSMDQSIIIYGQLHLHDRQKKPPVSGRSVSFRARQTLPLGGVGAAWRIIVIEVDSAIHGK